MDISILGCGWLGLPLAKHLMESGHTLKGSTTHQNKLEVLENAGIEPYLIKLTPELQNTNQITEFWQSDLLFINIPSRVKDADITEYHPRQIQSIITAVGDSSIERVIFAGSTGVYPAMGGLTSEEDAAKGTASRDSGEALLTVEEMLFNHPSFQTTVVRFGGLFGYDRDPIKFMSGRTELSKANAPVNLIHRDDCVSIITQIIEDDINSEIFNAVCDHHPSRKTYYSQRAKQTGLEPPQFKSDDQQGYRKVSNDKLKSTLHYTFKVNNLFETSTD